MQNWLGIAGAFVSNFLINNVFGYFTLILSLIIISFGWIIFRRKQIYRLITISIYSLLLMVVLASSSGLLKIFFVKYEFPARLSGAAGDFLSNIVYQFLGSVGASIFFLLFLFITVLLIIDGNILKTLARIKLLFEKLFESFKSEKNKLKTKSEEKKKIKTEEIAADINPEDTRSN